MPTYKHPCPHCGKYIDRVVKACPFCLTPEPFTTPPTAKTAPQATQPTAPSAVPDQGKKCTGCGAPLAAGARFCTVCGTLTS